MIQEELVSKVAEKSGISQTEALNVINAFTEEIKQQLIKGEKVTIAGFGSFILSQRKAKTLPHFKAAGDFKNSIRK